MNNKRLYKQVKDLHLGKRLSYQTAAEEFGETMFTTEYSNSLVALFIRIKKNLHWSKDLLPD